MSLSFNTRPRRPALLQSLAIRIAAGAALLGFVAGLGIAVGDAILRSDRLDREARHVAGLVGTALVPSVAGRPADDPAAARALDALVKIDHVRRAELRVAGSTEVARIAWSNWSGKDTGTGLVEAAIEAALLTRIAPVVIPLGPPGGSIEVDLDARSMAADLYGRVVRHALMALAGAILVGAGVGLTVWRGASRPIWFITLKLMRLRDDGLEASRDGPYFLSGRIPLKAAGEGSSKSDRDSVGLDPRRDIGFLANELDRFFRRASRARTSVDRVGVRDLASGASTREVALDHLRRAIQGARRERMITAAIVVKLDPAANDGPEADESLCELEDPATLRAAADRLRASLREGDTIGRFNDSSFLVVAERLASAAEASEIAARLHEAMRMPALIGNADRSNFKGAAPKLSIGVAFAPEDGDEALMLAELARNAARAAQSGGGDTTRFHSRIYDERVRRRRAMERNLAVDVAAHGVGFAASRLVRARDGNLAGVEIVADWRGGESGQGESWAVRGRELAALCEDCGLGTVLATLLLRECARVGARLHRFGMVVCATMPARASYAVALQALKDACAEYGCPPETIEIRIPESALALPGEGSDAQIEQIREAGYAVSVDGFGTAANFAYLKPGLLASLVLDPQFTSALPAETRFAASVCHIAELFSMRCAALGVERVEQAVWLAARGVDTLQGPLFGEIENVESFIAAAQKPQGWSAGGWGRRSVDVEREAALVDAEKAAAGLSRTR